MDSGLNRVMDYGTFEAGFSGNMWEFITSTTTCMLTFIWFYYTFSAMSSTWQLMPWLQTIISEINNEAWMLLFYEPYPTPFQSIQIKCTNVIWYHSEIFYMYKLNLWDVHRLIVSVLPWERFSFVVKQSVHWEEGAYNKGVTLITL